MEPGAVVADRFEVAGRAGAGGMGTVYRARDRTSGRWVALKMIDRGIDRLRFLREAEVLARVAHPAIVRYVAHGETSDEHRFLATEWIEGEELRVALSRGPLSVPEAIALALRVAEALEAVHALGIVHRDVKPANLLLPRGDPASVQLVDFGIARLALSTSMTGEGTVLGTPGYMAPEQVQGEEVDARADVFSLGCVLYECLTGRAAFSGNHKTAVLAKVLLHEPTPVGELVPQVSATLADLVGRMLSKDRGARPLRGSDVAAALRGQGPLGPDATRPSVVPGRLGEEERSLLSVVIVGVARAPAPRGDAPTAVERRLPPEPDRIEEIARSSGARIVRLAAGPVLLVVSASGAATDQAVRAARAALALRALFPTRPVAVATGRGSVAGRWPIGEVIDGAVALLGSGIPVRIDELTAGLVGDRFAIGGDASSLVVERERLAPEARTLLGRPTPTVGRASDLAMLEAAYAGCVEESSARAVLVVGDAGVGKSRLRHELLARLRARPDAPDPWIALGDPMGAGAPMGLLARALRRAAGIRDADPLDVRRRKLRARVARFVAASEGTRVSEFLGELVGTPFADDESVQLRAARRDARLMGDQVRRAFEDLVAAECRAHPLVLVLEDLHWGDVATVEVCDRLLRNLARLPLLVLAFARPEVRALQPGLWAGHPTTEIRLGGLAPRAAEELARAVLGPSVDDARVRRIVEQAEGNAFLLEELVRATAEGIAEAPATALAIVAARLERLDGEERRVLRAASVFGRVFRRDGLLALLGGEDASYRIEPLLARLKDAEIVGPARASSEAELAFRHALVRDAAYGMLTDEDRRLGHRLAARWLESIGEPEAIVVAEHYERGGDLERAVAYWQRAGEQGLERHDLAGALAHARRGLEAGASGEARAALLAVEMEARTFTAEYAHARRAALEAMRLVPVGSVRWFRAAGRVAGASQRLGDRAGLLEAAAEIRAAGRRQSVEEESARIAALIFVAFGFVFPECATVADDALAEAESALAALGGDHAQTRARFHELYSLRAAMRGDLAGCVAEIEKWLVGAERTGNARGATSARVHLGWALLALGQPLGAERVLRAGLAESERMGLRLISSAARHNLGAALARSERLFEARALQTRAIEEFRLAGDRGMEGTSQCYLAEALVASGELGLAEEAARCAAELLGSARPSVAALAVATLARVQLLRGDAHEALETAQKAYALAASVPVEEGEASVLLVRAECLAACGHRERAREAIAEASRRLDERAAKIADPERRRTFLEGISDHARTRALAREWS